LGCIAKAKKQLKEACDWFKEAFVYSPDNPDAWSLLGNLHLEQEEWQQAQKKFERILDHVNKHDYYSLVALGNIFYGYVTKSEHRPKVCFLFFFSIQNDLFSLRFIIC
jgi:RNA polymerase-associated protein CTR9